MLTRERSNCDISSFPRYSIRSLLIVTALAAGATYLWTQFGIDFCALLAVISLCAVAGYVAGWTGRAGHECKINVVFCASSFVAFNWLLWFFNHAALRYVRQATDRDLVPLLGWMVRADRGHCFEVTAGLITVVIVFAAFKRNRQWLFVSGTICVLIWLILMVLGFVAASVSLIDLI